MHIYVRPRTQAPHPVLDVNIRAGFKQQFAYALVAVVGGIVQGGVPVLQAARCPSGVRAQVHACAPMCVYIHVLIHAWKARWLRSCVCVRVCVFVCVCTCIYIFVNECT